MNYINIGNHIYYKIPTLEVSQKNTYYYLGVVDSEFLYETYTVEPLIYNQSTYRYQNVEIFNDEFMPLSPQAIDEKKSHFQREKDSKKVSSICEYLSSEKFALMPNTIIVAAKFKNDFMDIDNIKNPLDNVSDEWIINFNSIPGIYYYNNELYIPKADSSILIIDGQHRLLGLEEYTKNNTGIYQVPVSFLLGLDNSVLAQLFYTINYNQKSVNKSLLYHLSSEFSTDLSEAKLIHEFIRILNENKISSLYGKIKMLGKGDGFISQAFMMDMLMPLFMSTNQKSSVIPIFRYYYINEEKQVDILKFLVKYFSAYKRVLDTIDFDIWKKGKTMFTKTVGIGSYIKIMPNIILELLHNKNESDYNALAAITEEAIYQLIIPIKQTNLAPYLGGGSLGLISKLSQEWAELINVNYFDKEYAMNQSWIKDLCNK